MQVARNLMHKLNQSLERPPCLSTILNWVLIMHVLTLTASIHVCKFWAKTQNQMYREAFGRLGGRMTHREHIFSHILTFLMSKNLLAASVEAPRMTSFIWTSVWRWSPLVSRQAGPVKDRNPVHHQLMDWVCMRCGLWYADFISNKSSFLVQRKRLDNHQSLKWQLVLINSWHKVISNDPGYQSTAARRRVAPSSLD